MIELFTGVPGAAKTLSVVHRLAELQKKFVEKPEQTRPVFVHGVPDLLLPHFPLPLKQVRLIRAGDATFLSVPDWSALPNGALVIIDEAQKIFVPRSSQSAAPPHVEYLSEHRHDGLDIWLVTQNPRLIDHGVRALVGRHIHYRRMFGGGRSVTYEWDSCCDSLSSTSTAVKGLFSHPSSSFRYYKSAEEHTKQHFKKPLWLWIPVLGLAAVLFFVPRAFNIVGARVSAPSSVASVASGSVVAVVSDSVSSRALLDAVPVVDTSDQRISACLASASRCRCYTDAGLRLVLSDEQCRVSASELTLHYRLPSPGGRGAVSRRVSAVAEASPSTNESEGILDPVPVVPEPVSGGAEYLI